METSCQEIGNQIAGVIATPLKTFTDVRGYLTELFRCDSDTHHTPLMAYASWTKQGVIRGPHEHKKQSDMFCFVGPGIFRLSLWDNRKFIKRPQDWIQLRFDLYCGENNPLSIIVPPGVVHGYQCIDGIDDWGGLVFNLPNRLYGGIRKSELIDEIRHESDENSIFRM